MGPAACLVLSACGPSGAAPTLDPVADRVVAANQEVLIVLSASDVDSDELEYTFAAEVPDISGRATISRLSAGDGEFRWLPLAADVGAWTFSFTVSDGSHDDTVSAVIDVRAAVGEGTAPRFVRPVGEGTTLDLEAAECVELAVEVEDPDSSEVTLGQLEPLVDGAELTRRNGLAADWSWCPSPAQIEADDRYSAVFAADDEENPRAVHPYLVVLRRPTKPDCPGQAPVIAHEPSDQDRIVAITVAADISDDQGLKREPLLYVSDSPPSDPPDLAQMTQLTMQLSAGNMMSGTWTASVANPIAGTEPGASRELYYLIVVSDDDDPAGSCDHRSEAPETGVFTMTVTNPGGEGGGSLCEPCTHDIQCGGPDDLCVTVGTGGGAFCLSACDGPDDCPAGTACSSGPVESVVGESARQCVPETLDCDPEAGLCQDDDREENDSASQARFEPPLPAGSHELVSCPSAQDSGDDEDWFEVEVEEEGRVQLSLAGGSASDLDLALFDQDLAVLDASQSFTSEEAVSACVPPGTYLARVFAFGPATNPYSLQLSVTPESCAPTCTDDDNEDDDGPEQARTPDIFPDPFAATDQSICSGDDDWYRVDLFNGEHLVVDLLFEQTSGQEDLDIHLHNAAGADLTPCTPEEPEQCLLDNGQSADSDEHFEALAPASGCAPCTFFVVVRGFDGSENTYDISIGLE